MSTIGDENAGIPVSPRKLLSPAQSMGIVLKDSNRANVTISSELPVPGKPYTELKQEKTKEENKGTEGDNFEDDGIISFKLPAVLSDDLELNPFLPKTCMEHSPVKQEQPHCEHLQDSAQNDQEREGVQIPHTVPVYSEDPQMTSIFEKELICPLTGRSIFNEEGRGALPSFSEGIVSGEYGENCKFMESKTDCTEVAELSVCNGELAGDVSNHAKQRVAGASEDSSLLPDVTKSKDELNTVIFGSVSDGLEPKVHFQSSVEAIASGLCKMTINGKSKDFDTAAVAVLSCPQTQLEIQQNVVTTAKIMEELLWLDTLKSKPVSLEDLKIGLGVFDPFKPNSQLPYIAEALQTSAGSDLHKAGSYHVGMASGQHSLTLEEELESESMPPLPEFDIDVPENESSFGNGRRHANTLDKGSPSQKPDLGMEECIFALAGQKESDAEVFCAGIINSQENTEGVCNASEAVDQDLISSIKRGRENPFKANFQLRNTLSEGTTTTDILTVVELSDSSAAFSTMTVAHEFGSCEEINNFKPSKQVANSPTPLHASHKINPFSPSKTLANSPASVQSSHDEINPFKPNKILSNSPTPFNASHNEIDPLKPNKKLANSPTPVHDGNNEEIDPFMGTKKLANLRTPVHNSNNEEINPFMANKKLSNSPVVQTSDTDGNSGFLTRSDIAAPQEKDMVSTTNASPFKTKVKLVQLPKVESLDSLQPCQTKESVAEEVSTTGQEGSIRSSGHNASKIEASECPFIPSQITDSAGWNLEGQVFHDLGKNQASAKVIEDNPVLLASGPELGIDDDMFLPGAQVFSDPSAWDLLEKFGGDDGAKESDLRKQSLYVKFDPLVKPLARSPEKMPAPAHAAPRKPVNRHPEINASLLNNSVAEESLCLFGTPPRVARRRSVLNQRRINTSVSQTITEEEAVKPVDLFFMDGEADSHQFVIDDSQKRLSVVTTLVQVEEIPKFTESEWIRMQQTLKLQYEGQLLNKEREFASALQDEKERVTKLREQLQKVKMENKSLGDSVVSMKTVVTEYEKTLEVLIATKEKVTEEAKRKVETLQAEKDQALEDVQAWDKSFSELHRRYEKMKTVLDGFKKNEDTLKKSISTLQEKLKASEEKTVKVKACAEEKIAEVAKILEQTKSDNIRAEAELKRRQLQVQSLESTLEQKSKENKELTDLCETLINQVGGNKK